MHNNKNFNQNFRKNRKFNAFSSSSKTAYILAAGFIISALILGIFFVTAQKQVRSVRVLGQGVKAVTSDIAKWNILLTKNTSIANQNDGPALVQKELVKLKKYLKDNGIEDKNILIEPINSYGTYGNNGINGYCFNQRVEASSNDVEKIEKIALDTDKMNKAGIYLQQSNIEYYISNLADLKAEMLAVATVDAKARATRIAESAGNKICSLISAKTGVFQIRKPLSTDVSDYGIYDTSSKEKEISVTVNATFKLY